MIWPSLACAAAETPLAAAPPPAIGETGPAPTCPAEATLPAGFVVYIDKSERWLAAYQDGKLATAPMGPACFAVALGAAPAGDKAQRGDERTPVGDRRITHKNPRSRYHLSLGLDYPNTADADRALAEARIDAATHARIVAADRPGQPARNDSPLGGDLFLHGGGPVPVDWTDGCIAVDDAAIDWLFEVAGPGTWVRIQE